MLLAACRAAALLTYDSQRQRIVAVGCKTPAETWEWDGSRWDGPFPTPYIANIVRQSGRFPNGGAFLTAWSGPVQLSLAHPNALIDTPELGGVSTTDADGTLRTWNGSEWLTGSRLINGSQCFYETGRRNALDEAGDSDPLDITGFFPPDDLALFKRALVGRCFFPPLASDPANGRILAFFDGPKGLQELRLAELSAGWRGTALGFNLGSLCPPFPATRDFRGSILTRSSSCLERALRS